MKRSARSGAAPIRTARNYRRPAHPVARGTYRLNSHARSRSYRSPDLDVVAVREGRPVRLGAQNEALGLVPLRRIQRRHRAAEVAHGGGHQLALAVRYGDVAFQLFQILWFEDRRPGIGRHDYVVTGNGRWSRNAVPSPRKCNCSSCRDRARRRRPGPMCLQKQHGEQRFHGFACSVSGVKRDQAQCQRHEQCRYGIDLGG